jgi:hypothetical protein
MACLRHTEFCSDIDKTTTVVSIQKYLPRDQRNGEIEIIIAIEVSPSVGDCSSASRSWLRRCDKGHGWGGTSVMFGVERGALDGIRSNLRGSQPEFS